MLVLLDEQKIGTRRQEGRGGRRDEESEKMKKLLKKMKNEKVTEGRIIGLAGLCFFAPKTVRQLVHQLVCLSLSWSVLVSL